MRDADIVFNAAALKQVPSCEYFPFEAVQTNIHGAQNIVRCIRENDLAGRNGRRHFDRQGLQADQRDGHDKGAAGTHSDRSEPRYAGTQFNCVRYGNVIASRGSIIPLFVEQIKNGQPMTVTLPEMTRFLAQPRPGGRHRF